VGFFFSGDCSPLSVRAMAGEAQHCSLCVQLQSYLAHHPSKARIRARSLHFPPRWRAQDQSREPSWARAICNPFLSRAPGFNLCPYAISCAHRAPLPEAGRPRGPQASYLAGQSVKCAGIRPAASLAPQRQPLSIRHPDGRSRLTFGFLLGGQRGRRLPIRFGHVVKCTNLRRSSCFDNGSNGVPNTVRWCPILIHRHSASEPPRRRLAVGLGRDPVSVPA
jgi:hypothetical protein